jgi:hypothetical protein
MIWELNILVCLLHLNRVDALLSDASHSIQLLSLTETGHPVLKKQLGPQIELAGLFSLFICRFP